MNEHRWALVVVTRLTDRLAQRLTSLDYHDRLDLLDELRAEGSPSKQPAAMRGPVCLECRVDYETVHRDPHKPWPCQGRRPASLGGSLIDQATTPKLSRPQRRAQRRDAVKAAAADRPPGVVAAVESAVWMDKARRNGRREAVAARRTADEKLAENLAGAENFDGFYD